MKKLFSLVAALVATFSAMADEMPEGCQPCSVQNLEGQWVVNGDKNDVVLTFTTPTDMIDEDWNVVPMPVEISKVVICEVDPETYEETEIATIENPAKGTPQTYTVKDLAYGVYGYCVYVYVGASYDWGENVNVVVGELPADPDWGDLEAEVEGYNVTLNFTLPTLNSNYEPLTMPITKVEFGEMNPMTYTVDVLYTEDAAEVLEPGTIVEYVVEGVTDGNHTFTAQVYTASGSNYPATVDVFVGKDQPGMVENPAAVPTAEGILVSWEAPTMGLNGGDQGDLADITYTVVRVTDVYSEMGDTIVANTKDFSVLDATVFEEESKFLYAVTASSPYGVGYANFTDELVAGPAAQLPYVENFDQVVNEYGSVSAEHSTWIRTSTGFFTAWQFGSETYIGEDMVTPHNGVGLLYAFYNEWMNNGTTDDITSGHICFTGAQHPYISFWLYDVAGEGSDVTLSVQTSVDDVVFTTAESFVIGQAEETGWREVVVMLPALSNVPVGQVRLSTTSAGVNSFAVSIDELKIDNDNSVAISQLREASVPGMVYNLRGQAVKSVNGLMVVDGKVIFNK